MTVECQGVFDRFKHIFNLEPEKLKSFRNVHAAGDIVRLIFDDDIENAHSDSFKAFHALRDQYAVTLGVDKEYAKAILKLRHGICLPFVEGFTPPITWKNGSFVELNDRIYYQKSTTMYSAEELAVLIEGTIKDMDEIHKE